MAGIGGNLQIIFLEGRINMKKNEILISVIIPCYNGGRFIRPCLDSILNYDLKDIEIIVINDASNDESRKILSRYDRYNNVFVIENKTNLGAAKSRNLGVARARGCYLVFLDIDTGLETDFLSVAVDKFETNPKIGAMQAKLVSKNSEKVESGGHFLSPFGFPYEIGVDENEKDWNEERLIFGARSAAMAIRKRIFEKIGGFDEDYIIYAEETDLCWRVWKLGYQIIYCPQARVRHFQKSSLNSRTRYRIFFEGAKNNTANIIKNAPLKMWWMLPLHVLGWGFVCLKLCFTCEMKMIIWIVRGLRWDLVHLDKLIAKRKKMKTNGLIYSDYERIIFGDMEIWQLITKGFNWLKNV